MDFWMISRQELNHDLLDIFDALHDLQYQYDWVISDHDMWYGANCPEDLKKRWNWTGLLISGEELTEYCSAGYVHFVSGGVLSAVPLGTRPEQVWNHLPGWEVNFEDTDYQFQTPLTELEILCYDGYAWMIICRPEFSKTIQKCLPQACKPAEFYKR